MTRENYAGLDLVLFRIKARARLSIFLARVIIQIGFSMSNGDPPWIRKSATPAVPYLCTSYSA